MQDIAEAIGRLPKAELHMHIEGSIEPEMMFELAAKNGVELPWPDANAARAAYSFQDLPAFLKLFYTGLSVIVDEGDFFTVTKAYLDRAHRDNIVHAELFLSPQGHLRRGVAFETMMNGVVRALHAARDEYGISAKLLLIFQRHLPEEEGFPILDRIEPWRDEIVGFGLGGAELGNPPAKFARLFEACRRLGFPTVAHAGEEGPAAFVRDSLDHLKVARIDHGVRAAEDPALLGRLAAERVPLTVCPVSNVRLGVFPSLAQHNLRTLLRRGLVVTINSDDPAYFGAYMNETLLMCVQELGLTFDEVVAIVGNGFKAAFISEELRTTFLGRLVRALHQ